MRAVLLPSYVDRRSVFRALALVVLVLPASSVMADDSEAPKAIRKVLDDQVAAWNRKDLDGFCEGYWKSPELVFQSGGDRSKGFEAMRERYRKRYLGEGKAMGTLAFDEVEIVPLSDESAMVRGRWGLVMPDQSKPNGLFTLILRKFPEGWRIVHDHTSSSTEP